ncbi:MAG TPA: peptide chain release factor N(5)-glutamine methyltransferase [Candidatus Binatia bacterium]|nr:peptide chain release factor N(5)-glutamine methyltransferase [Candidatus Binatia bacterium]
MRTAVVKKTLPVMAAKTDRASLAEALQLGANELAQAGVESARLDAEALLRHVLGLTREDLFTRLREQISVPDQHRFRRLLRRRAAREPLAYITGHKEFWSLDFVITPAVLIPRPETELLVELILDHAGGYSANRALRILDIGAGSGAIAVTLAKYLPHAEVWAIDVSGAALGVAETNAKRHRVEKRMRFFQGDLFHALSQEDAIFDIIVSNPPYIRHAELAALAPEVCWWEPAGALDGGIDGLDFYRKIIATSACHLRDGGRIFFETGSELAEAVVVLFAGAGTYLPADTFRDYAGLNRVVAATRGRGRGQNCH